MSRLFIRIHGRTVDPAPDASLSVIVSSRQIITVTNVLHFLQYVHLLYGGTKQFIIRKSRELEIIHARSLHNQDRRYKLQTNGYSRDHVLQITSFL